MDEQSCGLGCRVSIDGIEETFTIDISRRHLNIFRGDRPARKKDMWVLNRI